MRQVRIKKRVRGNRVPTQSLAVMLNYKAVLNTIAESEQMKGFWRKYQTDFDYAKDID